MDLNFNKHCECVPFCKFKFDEVLTKTFILFQYLLGLLH